MNQIKESIFRAYDIRGIVETDLQDDVVVHIASAFAKLFHNTGKKKVIIGIDGRPSSPHIKKILIDTMMYYGIDILDIGLVPTPVMYYAITCREPVHGIMITASHNPAEYNGFKAVVNGEPQTENQVKEIYKIAKQGNFPAPSQGSLNQENILEDYFSAVINHIKPTRKVKVVVDAGNGTTGITAPRLYQKLGAEVCELYCNVDGTFPNHYPDPTKIKNLSDLQKRVADVNADLGLAFDGDGDRISVVTPNGNILWGDQITTLFVKDILSKHPGATVISEVKASQQLFDRVKACGGVPIMWKTGYTYIKQKMKEHGAVLGGEMSGHIFFNDRWFGFDDAVYTGARLIELIAKSNQTLDLIVAKLPNVYNTPEIRVETTEESKFEIVSQLTAHFKKKFPIIDIDGVRVTFPHGWAVVRVSNTQPTLVIRFEADSEENLEKIQHQVMKEIYKIRDQGMGTI